MRFHRMLSAEDDPYVLTTWLLHFDTQAALAHYISILFSIYRHDSLTYSDIP